MNGRGYWYEAGGDRMKVRYIEKMKPNGTRYYVAEEHISVVVDGCGMPAFTDKVWVSAGCKAGTLEECKKRYERKNHRVVFV